MIDDQLLTKQVQFMGHFLKNGTDKQIIKALNKALSTFKFLFNDSDINSEQVWVKRPDGTQLRLRIYKPKTPVENAPGVVWIHGGGYSLGIPEISIPTIKQMIQVSGCVVVAPDYRLSVEEPYPAALVDSYTALLWLKQHTFELGVDSSQLIVGGESAGGGLTAATTLLTRDRDDVEVAFQMPLYPMIDDRMDSKSARNNNAPIWNSKTNYDGWKMYLGHLFGSNQVPKYAAPSRETNYENLPPTITFVGDLEPFRDETINYIDNLNKAGVPVQFNIYEGAYHAFDLLVPDAQVSKEANSFFINAYLEALELFKAPQL